MGRTLRLLGAGGMLAVALGFSWVWAGTEKPLTLKECYDLALKQSEKIAVLQSLIKESEGRFTESLSGILPKGSFVYDSVHEERGEHDTTARFKFSQPLFSGFKEFAAMSAAKAENRQRRLEEGRAKQMLLMDVSDAFYLYVYYQQDLRTLEMIAKVLAERMEELDRRVRLGRSRQSELASAEVRLRRAQADIEQLMSDAAVARELLEFLTGSDVLEVQSDEIVPDIPSDALDWEQLASQRQDVAALREAVSVAANAVTVAKAAFWPTVSATANMYTQKSRASSGDWDVMLTVDVPLFQGGKNSGSLMGAIARWEQAKLKLKETERTAQKEIRQSYGQMQAAWRRELALKKAHDAAQRNYQLQIEDYRISRVSNLDVLEALTQWEELRRDYLLSVSQSRRFYWAFKVKSGDYNDVNF